MKKMLFSILSVLLVSLLFSPSAFSQDTVVRITPASVVSPAVGEQFTINVAIENGQNVAGYQVMVLYDPTALEAVAFNHGDYLSEDAFFGGAWRRTLTPQKRVRFAATSSPSEINGDGILGTLTFEVLALKTSSLTLVDESRVVANRTPSGTLLATKEGTVSFPRVENALVSLDGIGITIPTDLISEVAFGPNSTYFVLNAQFPTLTGVSDTDVSYRGCTITLDLPGVPDNSLSAISGDVAIEYLRQNVKIAAWLQPVSLAGLAKHLGILDVDGPLDRLPDQPQYFMFPLQTIEERRREIEDEEVRGKVIQLIGLIPLAGALPGAFVEETDKVEKISEIFQSAMDPKIVLDPWGSSRDVGIRWRNPGRPNDQLRYVLILPRQVPNIRITVEQEYVLKGAPTSLETIAYEGTWNLENNALAAPRAQPMTLADYPPFQQLPPETQEYLLHHFGEFANAEVWQVPEETSLLSNYPNPFNPETWIPYQLAKPAEVTVSIYSADGKLVRTLALGHQRAGIYQSRTRAAYWDGRNAQGEPVASGVYFYTLSAGDFTATRKMLIRK